MRPKVELLAPAGTFKAFETVIEAGADAVYLGGKRFNMRLHRKDYNLDDDELKKAVDYAHSRNVKLYVTVNNLFSDSEIGDLINFLEFLNEIKVDAIIIQDLMMLDLINDLKPEFQVHTSVMMNSGNLETFRYLKANGVSRVVTSREMTLEQIKLYKKEVDIEFEYFVHGDMCYAQSGQCLYSGILFGKSSNQGKCLKQCRWPWRIKEEEEFKHHLAVKDMCMFYNIRELIQSGVDCFKIEGRMRSPEYLKFLISIYRKEIDRYLADPVGYTVNLNAGEKLFRGRVREFSTCYAFGHPGLEFIDKSGKREPKFFSKAVREPQITEENTSSLKKKLTPYEGSERKAPYLTVYTPTFDQFKAVLEYDVKKIIIGGDIYRPFKPWTEEEIVEAIKLGETSGKEVLYRTPGIVTQRELNDLIEIFNRLNKYNLSVMTGNIGVTHYILTSGLNFSLHGDLWLNIFNSRAANFLKKQGFKSVCISLEAGCEELKQIVKNSTLDIEVVVQGPLRGMVSDNCLKYARNGLCKLACNHGILLEDEAGCYHRVEMDQYCRNHIFLQNHLSLMLILPQLASLGVAAFRIDGTFYSPEELAKIIGLYQKILLNDFNSEIMKQAFTELKNICKVPLTYGALITRK